MDLATFVPVSSADSFTLTIPTGFLMFAAARPSDRARNSASNAHCLFAMITVNRLRSPSFADQNRPSSVCRPLAFDGAPSRLSRRRVYRHRHEGPVTATRPPRGVEDLSRLRH